MRRPGHVRGLASLVMATVAACSASAQQPNLIVILTDDLGYADVGFNGCEDIHTPNIDRIAHEGARCTSGYVTYSVCGPSRAGLITGRYQDRFGASRNPTIDPTVPNNGVPLSEKNIAELLRPVGYRSMVVGKWHLGSHPDLRPMQRGFDEFYGFLSGGHDYFPKNLKLNDLSEVRAKWGWYRTKILRGETPIETDEYLTDELSHAAVDFVQRHRDRPFFLYLAYNAPHCPLQATEKYLSRFGHIKDPKRRTYAAMVSAVDDGVGRLLEALTEHGLDDKTIVFFLSDNGGTTENASRNSPLRDHKGSPFEGGVRVPFAVRWTGTIPAGVQYDHAVSSLDIAATIVKHSGAKSLPDNPLDGVDLIPYLSGENTAAPHPTLYWRWFDRQRYAVRTGEHKLILMRSKEDPRAKEPSMLYDLANDLGERSNLLHEKPSVAEHADGMLSDWLSELTPPLAPGLGSWDPSK